MFWGVCIKSATHFPLPSGFRTRNAKLNTPAQTRFETGKLDNTLLTAQLDSKKKMRSKSLLKVVLMNTIAFLKADTMQLKFALNI